MATLGKPQRQHRILRILEEQPVSSQSQLVALLEADGVVATQATVSRDLEELGAVKVRIPGGTMAYAIPARQNHFLLVALVLAHLAAISRQVDGGGGLSLLQRGLLSAFSPLQRAIGWTVGGAGVVQGPGRWAPG